MKLLKMPAQMFWTTRCTKIKSRHYDMRKVSMNSLLVKARDLQVSAAGIC